MLIIKRVIHVSNLDFFRERSLWKKFIYINVNYNVLHHNYVIRQQFFCHLNPVGKIITKHTQAHGISILFSLLRADWRNPFGSQLLSINRHKPACDQPTIIVRNVSQKIEDQKQKIINVWLWILENFRRPVASLWLLRWIIICT